MPISDNSFSQLAGTMQQKPKPGLAARVSGWIDTPLQRVSQPLGQVAGDVGAWAARRFAPAQEQAWRTGAQRGAEQLPRTVLDAVLTSRTGIKPQMLGFGDVALRSFAETPPSEPMTERLGSTAIQTGAWGVAPAIGDVAGAATKALTPKVLPSLFKTAVARGASLTGTLGAFEAANYAGEEVQGRSYNPFTAEHMAGVAASVLPFAALGVYGDVRNGSRPENIPLTKLADRLAARKAAIATLNTHQMNEPVKMEQEPISEFPDEKLTAAAVRTPDGKVTTGPHHPGILDQLGIKGYESRESRNTDMFGYATSLRPFVTRPEAATIAESSGQKLEEFETPGMPHSDEIAQPGTTKPISEGEPARMEGEIKLDDSVKSHLTTQESLGASLVDLADQTKLIQTADRQPNESPTDYVMRKSGLMLRSLRSVIETYLRDVLGMNESDVQRHTYQALKLANIVGSELGETRVIPAAGTSSYFIPERPNSPALIGILGQAKVGKLKSESFLDFLHAYGHESWHALVAKLQTGDIKDDKTIDSVAKVIDAVDGMTQPEMEQSIRAVLGSMASPAHAGWLNYRSRFYTEDPVGRQEYLADMYGVLAVGALSDKPGGRMYNTVADLLKYGNTDFVNVAKGIFKDIGSVVNAMKDFLEKMFNWKPSSIKTVEDIVTNLKGVMKSAEWADHATEAFLRHNEIRNAKPYEPVEPISYDRIEKLWKALGQDGYDPELKQMVQDVSEMVIPQNTPRVNKELPIRMRVRDYFTTMAMIGKSIPQLADMSRLGFMRLGLVKSFTKMIQDEFRDINGKFERKLVERIRNPKDPLNKAFTKVGLQEQELSGKDKGRRLRPAEMDKIPEYKSLSSEDKDSFTKMRDSYSSGHSKSAWAQVNDHADEIAAHSALIYQQLDKSLSWDKAYELGKATSYRYLESDRLDDPPAREGEEKVTVGEKVNAANKLLIDYLLKDPRNKEVLDSASKPFTTDDEGKPLEVGKPSQIVQDYRARRGLLLGDWSQPNVDTPEPHFSGKPGFLSEMRPGRFLLTWRMKDGKTQLISFASEAEYRKRFQSMADEYNADSKLPDAERKWAFFKGVDKANDDDFIQGESIEHVDSYNKAMTNLINRTIAALGQEHPGSEELVKDLRSQLNPASETMRLMRAPWLRERELVGGRETLNLAEGQHAYWSTIAHSMSRRAVTRQQRLYLNDPKMTAQPGLQNTAKKFFKEINDPTEKGFSRIKALVFFNYCMFSPSLAYVELTQQLTNHVPALVASGMGVGDAYKSIAESNRDYINAVVKGKKTRTRANVYDDPTLTKMVARYHSMHGTDSYLQELMHYSDDADFLAGNNTMTGGGEILGRDGLIGKPAYALFRMGVKAHDIAIHLNNECAFVSSYRYFSKTMSPEEAFIKAEALTHESMHGGGRANRPLWYLGIGPLSPGSTVGGLMYSLQMYVYGTLCQHARYLSDAIGRSGLTPAQTTAARKATGTALATQMVFAGILGLPFSTQAIALVEQIFPQSKPKEKLREQFFGAGEWLNSKTHLFAQDRDMGSFVADAAVDGLANSVPGAINIGNRFELGGLMGVSPYGGFDWKNMMGPAGDMFGKILEGAQRIPQDINKGDAWAVARDLIPNNQARRIAQLASDDWNVRNKDERLNVQLNTAEKVLLAAGFTPKKVTDFRELSEMHRRAEKAHSLEQRGFNEQMASLVSQGRISDVTQALWQRSRTVPNYDPREGARRIAELVQERTTPFDPTRTGTKAGATYKATETFRRQTPEVSETQRLLERFGLTQALGFPERLTQTEMQEAQLVDQLMQMYPTMSRVEAKAMLDRQLHPQRMVMAGMQL